MSPGKTILFGEIVEPHQREQPPELLDLGRGFLAGRGRATFDLQELIEYKTPIVKRVEEAGLRLANLSLHDELIRSPNDFQEDEFAAVLAPLESQLLPIETCPIGNNAVERCIYNQEIAESLALETRPCELVSRAGGNWLFSQQVAAILPEHLRTDWAKTELTSGKPLPYVAMKSNPEVNALEALMHHTATSPCFGCGTQTPSFPMSFVAKPEDEPGIIQIDSFSCGNHDRLHPYYFPLGDAIDWMQRFRNRIAFVRVHNAESRVVQLAQDLIALTNNA